MLARKVRNTIRENGLLSKGDTVLVALSGGADSVSLLVALQNWGEYRLCAAHLNHQIRGEEADRDEKFCRELCQRLGVEFFCERADIPKIASERGISLETCAREVRYAFLEKTAAGLGAVIATAHNADDNVETLIMNICRGAGLDGLRGIPLSRGSIIRPLLYVTRDEVIAFLSEKGQDYVTDSTNLESDCTRNRIRLHILPRIKELYPNVAATVGRMTQNLSEDADFINSASRDCDISHINALHPSVKKRVLSRIAKELCGVSPEQVHIDELVRLCRDGYGISALPNGIFVTMKGGRLVICQNEKPPIPTEMTLSVGEKALWNGYTITAKKAFFDEDLCRKINNSDSFAAFNCDIINENSCFTVRSRRDGDKIFIAKRNITKSVKKLLNECSIPPSDRDSIPVIAAGNVLLWVYGAAKSGKFAPKKDCEAIVIAIERAQSDAM